MGFKALVGEQAGRTSLKPRLRAGQALGWGPRSGLFPAAPHRASGLEGAGVRGGAKGRICIWKPGGHSWVRSGTPESVKGLPKWS